MSELPFTWDRPQGVTIRIKDTYGGGVRPAGYYESLLIEHIEKANKLLEQTIDVLEWLQTVLPLRVWFEKAKPLLDNLKAWNP